MKFRKLFHRKKWASPKQTYKETEQIAKNAMKPFKPKRGPYA